MGAYALMAERRTPARGASPARPGTRPVTGRRLPLALPSARMAARTAPRGAREIVDVPRTGSLVELGDCKRTLLVTFRRDGMPVPTPVWGAQANGVLYVRSERSSGKVKRLQRDTRVLAAPCTVRGEPLGAPFEATATVVPREREPIAERALAERYGLGRWLFEWAMDVMRVDMCYLEIVPGVCGNPPSPDA
jgi:uncharacterized protein